MIFVTVGTQLPFPRLIAAMAEEAARLQLEVTAQVGPDPGTWPGLTVHAHLPPPRFEALFAAAEVVVAHAGIGTILSARRMGKPLIICPRDAARGEHRNNHQHATAQQVTDLPGLHVAWETSDLGPLLERRASLAPMHEAESAAHRALIVRLSGFIDAC
ncbi:glycosyltransferase 28 domain (plasmid) [Dinoroseobacter shibae DFL 12 = DSM 16493]|uniref:Glycosyltransferase 28 domain n=1 Tax=Dinoroseobacter shibae (strain DSM 16493 / NCIMB 14021 / DFL 12) TaxID=398580 RepID=A8LUC8_DINSH|nr:glycosyltransferase [Dinoroseobacter shibae]ABV95845.1 glycosyltransferase 28 domain [Dinoroseobacter shibae DFL 12 = DSM 16493]URF49091.1 glycosyltransferase family 28 protein [Dinoroseobacter shibae]URF53400.1 glycosyltransferase family 28 protein [Dinoroseobacter shibae]